MRLSELLIEKVVHSGLVNDIYVEINDHSHERNERRTASPRAVDSIINKLPAVRHNIEKIEPGAGKFWVYSTKWNTAVGFMRHTDKDGKLRVMVNTLLSDPPHPEGIVPVFYIP
jgi:hypothetical protein